MQKRGTCLPVLGPRLFFSVRCKYGTKKQPCTNVVGRPGSKLAQQLGIERTEILILATLNILPRGGGGVRARKKERKREKVRA